MERIRGKRLAIVLGLAVVASAVLFLVYCELTATGHLPWMPHQVHPLVSF